MKVGVFIGRFQPFHLGHATVVQRMAQECQHVILVLGSSNRHRSVKNPLSFQQRKTMIHTWWYHEVGLHMSRLSVVPAPDNLYKDWSWKANVVKNVENAIPVGVDNTNIYLYGHMKDDSSYYLNLFPEWKPVRVQMVHDIHATGIRQSLFESGIVSEYKCLPRTVAEYLRMMKKEDKGFQDLQEEWEFYHDEGKKFASYPYPETLNFVCSDAVVVCQGHILMVKRKHAPGKNTWALPGGFKNGNETFLDACVRELKEETNIRVPEKVLRGSIKSNSMFDSTRRTIGIPRVTMAYYIEIAPNFDGSLPEVRPASDAGDARWIPFAEAMTQDLFDDHLDIIRWFI